MPRNKYPEETVQKILDVSMKLFLEKGYEETTILDIVGELGGLTRGAFYHHFKSKEEVLDALSDRMFLEHNPFEEVRKEKGLSGLEKLKKIIKMQAQNQDQLDLNQMSVPLLKNPKILADYMESNLRIVTPFFELFLEGIPGRLHSGYQISQGTGQLICNDNQCVVHSFHCPLYAGRSAGTPAAHQTHAGQYGNLPH